LLKEYDTVEIVKLLKSNRKFEGTRKVKRPPQIGDVGAIVFVAHSAEDETYINV
jgi:hypothetical protein